MRKKNKKTGVACAFLRLNQHPQKRGVRERGSAILVVLIIMGIVTTLAICNSVILHQLHQELNRVERQQQKRLSAPATARTAGKPSMDSKKSPSSSHSRSPTI